MFYGSVVCQCAAQNKCSQALYRQAALALELAALERKRSEVKLKVKDVKAAQDTRKDALAKLDAELLVCAKRDTELREQMRRHLNSIDPMEQLKEQAAKADEYAKHLATALPLKTKKAELASMGQLTDQMAQLNKQLNAIEDARIKVLDAIEKL